MAGTLARFFAGASSVGAFAAIRSNPRLLQDAQKLYDQILPPGGGAPLSGADESNSRSGDSEPDKIWALVAVVATGMTQEIKQEARDDDEAMTEQMTPLTWHLVQLLAEASVGLQEFLLYFTSLFNRLLLEPELLAATTLLKEEFTVATLLFEKYRVLWEALGPKEKQKKKIPTDPEPESAVQEQQTLDKRRKVFEAGWLLFLLAKRRLSSHYSGLGQLYSLLLAVLHLVITNAHVSQPSVEAEVAAALSAMGALGDADAKPTASARVKTSAEILEALCATPKVDQDDVVRASGHLGLVLQQLRDEKVLQDENGQQANQGVTVFANGVLSANVEGLSTRYKDDYLDGCGKLDEQRERLRNNDFSKLLNNEVFLAALFACSAEVMLKAHSLITISYPFLLDHLHVNAFHFVTTSESFVKYAPKLPASLKKHMSDVKNRILDSMVWRSDSALYQLLTASRTLQPPSTSALGTPLSAASTSSSIDTNHNAVSALQMFTSAEVQTLPVAMNQSSPKRVQSSNVFMSPLQQVRLDRRSQLTPRSHALYAFGESPARDLALINRAVNAAPLRSRRAPLLSMNMDSDTEQESVTASPSTKQPTRKRQKTAS
ncbi:Retinoblastoma-like protein 1 [Phytophthora boehmeriae]|uniref:Retinoblastoma-like protein 1 n=1 Tax=Phytophthora boehmeriae TaxID=109152 RepID=A0A8T1X7T9_9STRA|nr:Retinoblastoma-like protein 1 [Phytophthora boehmeriae]